MEYTTYPIGKIEQDTYSIFLSHVREADMLGGQVVTCFIKLTLFEEEKRLDQLEVASWQGGNIWSLEEMDYLDGTIVMENGKLKIVLKRWTEDSGEKVIKEETSNWIISEGKFALKK